VSFVWCCVVECSNHLRIIRLRLNSLLATYDTKSDKKKTPVRNQGPSDHTKYPPLRERTERERPRSIKLKPQEYFLFAIAILAISALVIYNIFMSYYNYYKSIDDNYDWFILNAWSVFAFLVIDTYVVLLFFLK
jgi:hypothetical protein